MKLDIIGDIHGCYKEFKALTNLLGYDWSSGIPLHKEGRKLAFIGDLTDRGPQSLQVALTVIKLVKGNHALYVPGNHCNKLYRFFLGNQVQISHGLETTVAEYERLSKPEKDAIRNGFMNLYEGAPLHAIVDNGKLVLAHAGIREDFIGETSERVKTFVLYGDISGKKKHFSMVKMFPLLPLSPSVPCSFLSHLLLSL